MEELIHGWGWVVGIVEAIMQIRVLGLEKDVGLASPLYTRSKTVF